MAGAGAGGAEAGSTGADDAEDVGIGADATGTTGAGAGATEVGTTEASPPSGRAGGPGVADAVIAVMETSRTR